jgi:hypothetical protein
MLVYGRWKVANGNLWLIKAQNYLIELATNKFAIQFQLSLFPRFKKTVPADDIN